MGDEIKTGNISIGFIMDLGNILNYLKENNGYSAKIGKITISHIGDIEDKQVFEIERKI